MVRSVLLKLSHIRSLLLLLDLPPHAKHADMCRDLAPIPASKIIQYIQTLVKFTPSSSWLPALKVLWSLNHPSSRLIFSAVVELGGAAAMMPGIPRPSSPLPYWSYVHPGACSRGTLRNHATPWPPCASVARRSGLQCWQACSSSASCIRRRSRSEVYGPPGIGFDTHCNGALLSILLRAGDPVLGWREAGKLIVEWRVIVRGKVFKLGEVGLRW